MENGVLIAVPIPEEYAAKGELIQWAVNQAVRESEENGMSKRGKEVTPWLLSRVAELTKHDSIDSNIALLKNTALIGFSLSSLRYTSFAHSIYNRRTDSCPISRSRQPSKRPRCVALHDAIIISSDYSD